MTGKSWHEVRAQIYEELDKRIESSSWDGSVSEAHGLLTGLACSETDTALIADKFYLFQELGTKEPELLEAIFAMITEYLESDSLTFNLLLPGDETDPGVRIEELANWCSGFILGYCHESSAIMQHNDEIRELLDDIIQISALQADQRETHMEQEVNEQERSLMEIEEYLRVSIQLIYEESMHITLEIDDSATTGTYH